MYIHIYIERHTKQPRKWMRKRKEGAKEREMESSRGNGRWNGEEKGRECGEGGRVRERERERERGSAGAREYVTGMARGQLTFIILTLMDYLIPYIPYRPFTSPLSLSFSFSLSPFTSPDTLLGTRQSTG